MLIKPVKKRKSIFFFRKHNTITQALCVKYISFNLLLIPDGVSPVENDRLVVGIDGNPGDLSHVEVGCPVVDSHGVRNVIAQIGGL